MDARPKVWNQDTSIHLWRKCSVVEIVIFLGGWTEATKCSSYLEGEKDLDRNQVIFLRGGAEAPLCSTYPEGGEDLDRKQILWWVSRNFSEGLEHPEELSNSVTKTVQYFMAELWIHDSDHRPGVSGSKRIQIFERINKKWCGELQPRESSSANQVTSDSETRAKNMGNGDNNTSLSEYGGNIYSKKDYVCIYYL